MADRDALSPAARAFLEGDVALLPGALGPGDATALVEVLVAEADAARLQRLAGSADKGVGKLARRALHRLRTKGVAVAPAPLVYRASTHGPFAADDEAPSLASMIDGRGERVVWLARAGAGFGFDLFEAELSESEGLLGFTAIQVTRKAWREHVRRAIGNPRLIVAEVPGRHVRWLIERAYARSAAIGRAVPEAFALARLDLGQVVEPTTHPVHALVVPAPREVALPQLAGLLGRRELETWIPPREIIEALEAAVTEVAESPLALDAGQREGRLDAVVAAMAARLLEPDPRARLADRLEETAYLMARRGEGEPAALALAACALTRDLAVDAAGNPLVRVLIDRLVDRAAVLGEG